MQNCQYFLEGAKPVLQGNDSPLTNQAFLIRGRPNSKIFLPGLRKLFKRGKFFVVPEMS